MQQGCAGRMAGIDFWPIGASLVHQHLARGNGAALSRLRFQFFRRGANRPGGLFPHPRGSAAGGGEIFVSRGRAGR
jgi:hypothetical protein